MKRYWTILKRTVIERNYAMYFAFLVGYNTLMSFGTVEFFRLVIEAVTKIPTTLPEVAIGYFLIFGYNTVQILDLMEFIIETMEDQQYLIDKK